MRLILRGCGAEFPKPAISQIHSRSLDSLKVWTQLALTSNLTCGPCVRQPSENCQKEPATAKLFLVQDEKASKAVG
jgi:hypothetical protein